MAQNILVSVITVSYNSAQYIRETIESVLAQQYTNFEYIICDDRSSDDTWGIVQQYTDPRVKAYKNEVNLGEYENRNKAITYANGDYLIFIDGDDAMYPHALTTFVSYATQFPDCATLIAKDWDYRMMCPYKVLPADFFRFEYFDRSILGNFSKLLFKTEAIKKAPFPKGIRFGDSYIQLKLGQKYPSLVIPDGLTWWRRRSGNATSNLLSNSKHYAETTNVLLEMLDENCPLPANEIEEAKVNVYGIHLRMIFWLIAKRRFSEASYLKKQVTVPSQYFRSFFVPRKKGVFDHVSGDAPFHTVV